MTVPTVLVSRVRVTETGCWIWLGHITRLGYGSWRRGKAHRIAYELFVGPIPAGLTIDHLCRNRACVNPAHLEPVTQRENVLRGLAPAAHNARKTHCDRGHPFDEENTVWRPRKLSNGGTRMKRERRICGREWRRNWHLRNSTRKAA